MVLLIISCRSADVRSTVCECVCTQVPACVTCPPHLWSGICLPGTLVVGRYAPRQAQLRGQRGLPGPPPALRRSLPHLLLHHRAVGGLRRDRFHRILTGTWLLSLVIGWFFFSSLFLFLLLGPLLGKKQPYVRGILGFYLRAQSSEPDREANSAPSQPAACTQAGHSLSCWMASRLSFLIYEMGTVIGDSSQGC